MHVGSFSPRIIAKDGRRKCRLNINRTARLWTFDVGVERLAADAVLQLGTAFRIRGRLFQTRGGRPLVFVNDRHEPSR